MGEDKQKKVTFWDKTSIVCPVCGNAFQKEKLMTGGGRVIAGNVTKELRRLYKESKKFGYVNPLIYSPVVCPHCWYAVLDADFTKKKEIKKEEYELLLNAEEDRVSKITNLFEGMEIDFSQPRTLESGTAAYILCVMNYSFFNSKMSPTIKRAICSLRTAWLLGDLEEKYKTGKFGYFQEKFYFKSCQYYNTSLEYSTTGQEPLGGIFLGPDNDKNYDFDGLVYIANLLNYQLGPFIEKDPIKLGRKYLKSKISIAKIFGFGRSSKEKPSQLLDTARDLYDQLNDEVNRIEQEFDVKLDQLEEE